MTETLKLNVDRRDGLAVIYTEGYINNQGGEEIARAAYELIGSGYRSLLLNLSGTKIVNSIDFDAPKTRYKITDAGTATRPSTQRVSTITRFMGILHFVLSVAHVCGISRSRRILRVTGAPVRLQAP